MYKTISFNDDPEPTSKVAKALGVSDAQWKSYKNWIGAKESNDRYDIMGGANNHYAGRYQMGKAAIADAAALLGEPVPATSKFLKDPKMQDRFFEAYTLANIGYLKGNKDFEARSPQEKLGIVGYAHNQGHGGAKKYMRTGQTGFDAFGTAGSDYLAAAGQAPGGPVMAGDPRGITEEDIAGRPALGAVGAPQATAPSSVQAAYKPIDFSTPETAPVTQMNTLGSGGGAEVSGQIMQPGQKALTPEQEFVQMANPSAPLFEGTDYGREMMSNMVPSTKKLVNDTVSAIVNIDDTAEGLYMLGSGLASMAGITEENPEHERVAQAVGEFYKERYGDWPSIKETFKKDPAGAISDLMTVITLGGGGVGVAARGTKVGQVANTVSNVATALDPAVMVTRPISAAGRGIARKAGDVGKAAIGQMTGAGPDAVGLAYQTGRKSGRDLGMNVDAARRNKAFNEQRKGKAEYLMPVESANRAVGEIKAKGKKFHDDGMVQAQKDAVKNASPALQQKYATNKATLRNAGVPEKVAEAFAFGSTKVVDLRFVDKLASRVERNFRNTATNISKLDDGDLKILRQAQAKMRAYAEAGKKNPGANTIETFDDLRQSMSGYYDRMGTDKGRAAIAQIKQSMKDYITRKAPVYGETKKAASETIQLLDAFTKELQLGKPGMANMMKANRALQSAMRAGAHQGWRTRFNLLDIIKERGGSDVLERMAGQAFDADVARGLAGYLGNLGAAFSGLASMQNLGQSLVRAATALVGVQQLTNPRMWGGIANKAGMFSGAVAGTAGRVPQGATSRGLFQAGRLGEAGVFDDESYKPTKF